MEFWSIMQGFGNFTYSVIENNDPTIFNETSGRWTGQLGLVESGEADIAVSSFGVTTERLKAFYFFDLPLIEKRLDMDIVVTDAETGNQEGFWDLKSILSPFSVGVWVLVLVYIFAQCVVAALVSENFPAAFIRSLETHIRLFSQNYTPAEYLDFISQRLQLFFSSFLALMFVFAYSSSINADSALQKVWKAPFYDVRTMAESGYVFLEWAQSTELAELRVGFVTELI